MSFLGYSGVRTEVLTLDTKIHFVGVRRVSFGFLFSGAERFLGSGFVGPRKTFWRRTKRRRPSSPHPPTPPSLLSTRRITTSTERREEEEETRRAKKVLLRRRREGSNDQRQRRSEGSRGTFPSAASLVPSRMQEFYVFMFASVFSGGARGSWGSGDKLGGSEGTRRRETTAVLLTCLRDESGRGAGSQECRRVRSLFRRRNS